jgi:hypothetical protein
MGPDLVRRYLPHLSYRGQDAEGQGQRSDPLPPMVWTEDPPHGPRAPTARAGSSPAPHRVTVCLSLRTLSLPSESRGLPNVSSSDQSLGHGSADAEARPFERLAWRGGLLTNIRRSHVAKATRGAQHAWSSSARLLLASKRPGGAALRLCAIAANPVVSAAMSTDDSEVNLPGATAGSDGTEPTRSEPGSGKGQSKLRGPSVGQEATRYRPVGRASSRRSRRVV